MSTKKHLIVIGGPTASGKTGVAIQLARHFKTEIISADSRQFYREMSIGTAKPDEVESAAAPHHFINSLSIEEEYTVGDFEREAIAKLEKLYEKHDILIMVGGSGLFIRAVCFGLDEFPEVSPEINDALKKEWESKGLAPLQKELQELDPDYAEIVDLQNPVRLIRALGVCRTSGQPYSSFRKGEKTQRNFTPIFLKMEKEREKLYERINLRVDKMMEKGLLAEAEGLFEKRHLNALQTVGYQELFDYFSGNTSLEKAIELIKRNSRRYAKRQMTWFRKKEYWKGFVPGNVKGMIEYIKEKITT